MKLRYYLRGLGIGMLAAAFILLLFSNKGKETLSEQEIIKKAEALGMVKEEELLFKPEEEEEIPKEGGQEEQPQEEQPAKAEEPEDSKEDNVSSNSSEKGQPEEEDSDTDQTGEPEAVPENADMQPVPDTAEDMEIVSNGYEVRFRISQGTYGEKLSLNLQKSGLIENWLEFSEYLTSNGYSVKLMTGTYTIPVGSTYEQIAKIITSKSGRDQE